MQFSGNTSLLYRNGGMEMQMFSCFSIGFGFAAEGGVANDNMDFIYIYAEFFMNEFISLMYLKRKYYRSRLL